MNWSECYWHKVPVMKSRIEELAKRTRPGRVLDLGCNDGQLSQCIFEMGNREVIGVDVVEEYVEKSKSSFSGPQFIHADGESLPFPDGHFDTVVAAELLEHLGKNQGKVLSELHRVSRGHMLWSLPIGEYWLGEPTHQWRLEGCSIAHDTAEMHPLPKDIIIIEWIRARQLTP